MKYEHLSGGRDGLSHLRSHVGHETGGRHGQWKFGEEAVKRSWKDTKPAMKKSRSLLIHLPCCHAPAAPMVLGFGEQFFTNPPSSQDTFVVYKHGFSVQRFGRHAMAYPQRHH